MSLTKIRVKEKETGKILFVNVIGAYKLTPFYKSCIDKEVIVGGRLQYSEDYDSFSMMNPEVFSPDIKEFNRILPKYHKYKGITEEKFNEVIKESVQQISDIDYIPANIVSKYKLLSHKQACQGIHYPSNVDVIKQAQKRIVFDDLLYFNCKIEKQNSEINLSSPYIASKKDCFADMINNLPYKLTNGQYNAVNDMASKSIKGERISALVQGDVGSGKTIVAFLMMILMAENGYQAVLMAPTTVLAKQHYLDLKDKAAKYGFRTVLLSNELKASEKKSILKEIASGEVQLVVGTHSCVSKDVIYKDLAITITDEEHKFGVIQRETLQDKGAAGTHNVIMSGTPIPRTLANTIYGDYTTVYSMELPGNRKPIKTAICQQNKTIFEFMLKEISNGRQCYIVSPLIETAAVDSSMEGVKSLEENAVLYKNYFEPKGIKIGVISGKTSKDEQAEIVKKFSDNEIQILMATTVIEVGINVPNATVMVITGAERFGLATLHQLRGRVGRGEYQSYCILQKSPHIDTKGYNLEVLCSTTDGLEIAKADLQNRGTGNIVGTAQSGENKYISLMLTYPNMFKIIKEIAKEMCKNATAKEYIETYEELYALD